VVEAEVSVGVDVEEEVAVGGVNGWIFRSGQVGIKVGVDEVLDESGVNGSSSKEQGAECACAQILLDFVGESMHQVVE